jgi:hypothetical protein
MATRRSRTRTRSSPFIDLFNFDSKDLLGELVGDVQIFKCPAISGLIEREVQRPHMVGVLRTQPVTRSCRGADSGAFAFLDPHPQALITAKPLHALAIYLVALPGQQGV